MAVYYPPDVEKFFTLEPKFWKEGLSLKTIKPQDIVDSQSHTFKTKVFKHPHTCAVCKEIIWNEGRTCRVCKFACHKKCEFKVVTACTPPVNYPLPSNEGLKTTGILKSPSSSSDSKSTASMSTATANSAPVAVTTSGGDIGLKGRNGDGLVRYSFDLEVDYITERIIAVSFPAGGLEAQYRSNLRDVVAMLKTKHENNYIIFNLSRRRQDISKLNNQVYDLGWPNQLAPPLERLCSICKHIETWLKSDPQHVIVLHCKGGRGPIGTVISAFMNYINITASAETMLDRYAMKRFLDAKAIPIMHPSQHRYVGYFMGLLQGSININSAPLYLHNILIHGVPNFDSSGGCRPFVRIYQGMQPVYTSGVYSIPEGTSRFAVSLDQALPLRGDILVKCYHKKFRATTRDVIFRCQFHTTAVVEYRLEFKKHELDDASTDARFPEFTKVELIFSATPEKVHGSDYVPTDSNFPVDNTDDPLIRWDSYENFNKVVEGEEDIPQLVPAPAPSPQSLDIPHSSAPDGSLYAQVKKSPSPETNPGQPLMTSTPARNAGPIANGPSQVNGPMANGPTRPMNHKEKTELDELLRGIGEDLSDSGRIGSEEANRQHSSPRFVNPQVHVTSNGGTRQTIPAFAPEPAGGTKPPSLTRQRRSDMENPYAEITDGLVRKQEQQLVESARSPARPVEEEVITSQVVKVEESSMPLFNGLDESTPGGKQGHNVPDRTPNGFVSHGTQYSPQVTPQTSHRTLEPRAHSMPNSPTRFAPQVNGGHQSPPPNVYQPQPVRAQKEQIRYITRVTPPGTPIADKSFEEQLPEQTLPETQPMQPFKRSTSPDDSMSWLQKQQQKLREKRAREGRRQPVGDLVRSGPWREPSVDTSANRIPEPIREFNQAPKREAQTYAQREPQNYAAREPQTYAAREPQTYAAREPQTYASREPQMYTSREPQTYATREPQTYAPREPQPNGNMSWLEIQQQKLRERQEYGLQKPLYVDTSHHTTPSQMSPLRSDSGLSSPASQYKASSEISPSTSASSSIRYGRPTSPIQQLDDLEKSISELESLRNLPHRSGAPTPPNTYVNYQQTTETSWQSHQRPLNRQTSDTSHDREQIPVYRRQPEEAQAPSYGANTAVTSLPPPSPRKDGPRPGSPGSALITSTSPPLERVSLSTPGSIPPLEGSVSPLDCTSTTATTTTTNQNAKRAPSRDSGYASSVASAGTASSNQNPRNTIHIFSSGGVETKITTCKEHNRKVIHVFPTHGGTAAVSKNPPSLEIPDADPRSRYAQRSRSLGNEIDDETEFRLPSNYSAPSSPLGTLSRDEVWNPHPQGQRYVDAPSPEYSQRNRPDSSHSMSYTNPNLGEMSQGRVRSSVSLPLRSTSPSTHEELGLETPPFQFSRPSGQYASVPTSPKPGYNVPSYDWVLNRIQELRENSRQPTPHSKASFPNNPRPVHNSYSTAQNYSRPTLFSSSGLSLQGARRHRSLPQPPPRSSSAVLMQRHANSHIRSSGFADDQVLGHNRNPRYAAVHGHGTPTRAHQSPHRMTPEMPGRYAQRSYDSGLANEWRTKHNVTSSQSQNDMHVSHPGLGRSNSNSTLESSTSSATKRRPETNNNDDLMADLEEAISMLSQWTDSKTHTPPNYNNHNKRGVVPVPSSLTYRSNTNRPLSASTPTTPTQGMDEVDLHIEEEPLNLEGLVKDRVANMTSKIVEHERSMSPPRGRSPRRSTGQSGYDSDTGVQQYYRPGRMRSPSPHDAWIQNPGGVPAQENEYWNRASGLKSPEMEREAQRQREFEMGSSNESLHSLSSAASGARTPKFPMAPKLKSMVSTPITYVGKPPHGPDAPPALKSVKRDHHDILDGPFSDLNTQSDVLQQPSEPQRTITTTERTVRYTETKTERTERRQNQYPIEAKVETVPVVAENKEPVAPQYPIEAKVEVKPASYHQQPQQFKQTTIEAKLETTHRVTPTLQNSDVIQPQSSQRLETPPPKPPHTIQYGAAPQEFRGGVPARPTSPLAVAGNVPNQQAAIRPEQARVEEQTIAPQEQVMEEMVIPQSVRKEESAPMHLEFRMRALNESPAPADTSPKRYAPQSPEKTTQPRSPEFVMPPMPNGTVKTPSPEHASKQIVEETPIMVQKVKTEESAPVQFQNQLQHLEESTIVPQQVKVEESEPEQLQQQLGQLEQPPASSSDTPTPTSGSLTPSFTDPSKPGAVQPPGVMYPTFSDRHRKAGPLRVDDSPNAGYKTMYDNKKQRSSTGSNEGVWPNPGSPHRGMPNGGITPTGSGRTTPSNFYHFQHHSPFGSNLSLVDPGVEKVRFVKDLSAWWYKPHATRDEAINMLRDKAPGSFVVRDSNSFPGAFGLAVKVAQLPPNAPPSKKGTDPANELVRHFLIEPNARGVRLKGCVNEPIFGSLSALIYQHTLTQLALPCKLSLPDVDPAGSPDSPDGAMDSKSITALLTQGAACNVLYLYSFDMESLTGPNAVREAMDRLECIEQRPRAIVVHFKVALKGITLTDSHRKLFFRRHYPVESVLFCGMEPGSRRWPRVPSQEEPDAKIYGFVARKPGSLTDNMCHLFAEYEREQPASAIVSFVTKVLLGSARKTTPKTP